LLLYFSYNEHNNDSRNRKWFKKI